jgi:hypothetical protein
MPDGSVSTRNSLPWQKYLKDAEHGGFAHLESIAAFSPMTSLRIRGLKLRCKQCCEGLVKKGPFPLRRD